MARSGVSSRNTVPSTTLTWEESGAESESSLSSVNSVETTGLSISKTLTLLRSEAANRSCADCRTVLIDPSTVYSSLCQVKVKRNEVHQKRRSPRMALQDFQLTHRAFAPPNSTAVTADGSNGVEIRNNKYDDDPAFSVNQRFGGHGVFICGRCAEAHRQLGIKVKVKRVMDSSIWTMEEAQFIASSGGNAQCWKIYEAFMPDKWKQRRPDSGSSSSDRLVFCRAKYEALAFCLPLPGSLAEKSWNNILRYQQEKHNKSVGSANIRNICSLSLASTRNLYEDGIDDLGSPNKRKKTKTGLPNRLIDYFCVVSSSMQLLRTKTSKTKKKKKANYANVSSPESLDFWPHVTDCYPPKNTHGEMGYQDHISSFVMPAGCHPIAHPKPPSFSSFVLTMGDGTFVYGGALQIYDKHVDAEEIKNAMRDSGYEGEFPAFLMNDDHTVNDSDIFFFPKCLVVLSRYAFFNLFRTALLEIYQMSLIAAPLPIERYISNFVREIPLPPQGQVQVQFGFTADKKFTIERPAINELPMADFSYRPLFASLSVSNIIVVLGYLLQESRVVLLSKHNSLLTPVAEALLSAIFPFRWVGLYIPIAPLKMMDILDAPIPYLVGMSSDYFGEVDVRYRPKDAILVDLDRDVIHIGDIPLPKMPEQDVQKLTASLEEAGGSAYVIPNSGIKGCIMAGSKKSLLVQNENRPRYAYMTTMTGLEVNSFFRDELFSMSDLAYGISDDEAEMINNGHGIGNDQQSAKEETSESNRKKKGRPFSSMSPIKRSSIASPIKKFGRNKKAEILSRSHSAMSQGHLLDMTEPEGFSVAGIRNAFLRFVVATFSEYQESLLENSGRELFDEEKFVGDVGSRGGSIIFLKTVLKTQLFQRFLEERKDNPDLPEIRFFDESIVAKRNRSKKSTLGIKAKKPTPFLDDKTTWNVEKVFVSPSPNNFGIPDTEKTYRYGTFPALDKKRFGRIRPPVKWPQLTNLDSVRYVTKADSKMKKKQNEIFRKAIRPVLVAPNAVAAAAKRTAKDLESTLAALSMNPPTKQQETISRGPSEGENTRPFPPREKVKTLSTAETIMMDARRKQHILLDLIIQIQALCRRYLARLEYDNYKSVLLESRMSRERVEWERQQIARKELANKHRRLLHRKATTIQSFARMIPVRNQYNRVLRSIVVLQSIQRGRREQQQWKRTKHSALLIAKCVRGRRTKLLYQELRRMITAVQSRVRGVLVRTKMKLVVKGKMTAYTGQIFVLWSHLHVSLVFRTKVWTELSGSSSSSSSFLCLRLAESELLRLWDAAGLSERWNANGAKQNHNDDETTKLCNGLGLSNKLYRKSKSCADWIKGGGSVESKLVGNAPRMEEAERLQVYEGLNANVGEKDQAALYDVFEIPPEAKLKKVALSRALWTKRSLAGRSASCMYQIFPELHNSLTIVVRKPSPKGKRRFPKAKLGAGGPLPTLDTAFWDQISVEGTTKRHVQEVAMLFITKVPQLMSKLDANSKSNRSNSNNNEDGGSNANTNANVRSFLRAAAGAHGFDSIEQARHFVVAQYLGRTRE
eukprot:jgi/Psemu1/5747/gm1.5747_g